MKYVSEIDPALTYAKLEWKLLPKTTIHIKNKTYCLSQNYLKTPFATNYRILRIFTDKKKLLEFVKTLETERIIQHNMQIKLKSKKGTGKTHIFYLKGKYIVTIK